MQLGQGSQAITNMQSQPSHYLMFFCAHFARPRASAALSAAAAAAGRDAGTRRRTMSTHNGVIGTYFS